MAKRGRPITHRVEAYKLAGCSKRARSLYKKLCDGRFYKWQGPNYEKAPASMKELVDAGLVTTAGRVNLIVCCYVPTRGFKPLQVEKIYGR